MTKLTTETFFASLPDFNEVSQKSLRREKARVAGFEMMHCLEYGALEELNEFLKEYGYSVTTTKHLKEMEDGARVASMGGF